MRDGRGDRRHADDPAKSCAARIVVSNADPRRTMLGLVDPVELEPGFLERMRSYRCAGNVAKINLALSDLPRLYGRVRTTRALAGRIHIGPDLDYLERAFDASKYGNWSPRPYLDVTIPSLTDPALAPSGAHVMSITRAVCAVSPARTPTGARPARRLRTPSSTRSPSTRRISRTSDSPPPGHHARSIWKSTYGLTGGHIFHGELALDQLFTMRPLLGWARYRTPIGGLYLCGAGTHPGYGVSGLSGLNAAREILKDLK